MNEKIDPTVPCVSSQQMVNTALQGASILLIEDDLETAEDVLGEFRDLI